MMRRKSLSILGLALCAACGDAALSPDHTADPSLSVAGASGAGAVFVASNAAAGNAVLVFGRSGTGALSEAGSYPTGGLGTGSGLGNQGGLALTQDDRFLYAVNAGSDEISAFRVTAHSLELLGTVPSGGDEPISLAISGNLLYVLNDGTDPNITGFRIGPAGDLTPIPGSTRALSAAVPDAAQVGFSTDGSRLVVTEKATNQLVTFPVNPDGTPGAAVTQPSAGPTPFGFGFDKRGTLIVSEAFGGAPDASVLSSYRAASSGWTAVSPLAATTETAACWVVVSPNGRFVYTTNTGSASVSGYRVGHDGSLQLLDPEGVTATTGAGPTDADISRNGRYLYTLNSGSGSIGAYRIGADGSLTALGETAGLPAGANGLVAH
jgi:6-phosphogluconolactonase (cycloisomerase 2 family)